MAIVSTLDPPAGATPVLRQAFNKVSALRLVEGKGDAAFVADLAPGHYSVLATVEVSDRTGLARLTDIAIGYSLRSEDVGN
jgi:hypothetical protein